jgi:hypothetical protein
MREALQSSPGAAALGPARRGARRRARQSTMIVLYMFVHPSPPIVHGRAVNKRSQHPNKTATTQHTAQCHAARSHGTTTLVPPLSV